MPCEQRLFVMYSYLPTTLQRPTRYNVILMAQVVIRNVAETAKGNLSTQTDIHKKDEKAAIKFKNI